MRARLDVDAHRQADRARIRQAPVRGVGESRHEAAGLLGAEAAISGVVAGSGAGSTVRIGELPADPCAGTP